MNARRGFCLLSLLLLPGMAAPAQPWLPEVQRRIVEHTNRFRAAQGLPPLKEVPLLQRTAQGFAAYMARTDRYGHEADGREPAERAREQGYDFCLVAENIAFEYSSADFATDELAGSFVRGWQQSPPHRANMLDPDADETGVAVVQSAATRRYYAVQMFGRPMAHSRRFQIANTSRAPVSYRLDGKRHALPGGTTRTHRVCRVPKLGVELPGQPEAQLLKPADGQRLVIVAGPDGRLALRTP